MRSTDADRAGRRSTRSAAAAAESADQASAADQDRSAARPWASSPCPLLVQLVGGLGEHWATAERELRHDLLAARAMRLMTRPESTGPSRRPTSRSARSSTCSPRASTTTPSRSRSRARPSSTTRTSACWSARPRPRCCSCASTRATFRNSEGARLGLPRHRRLHQDLHPRRLPGRPLRAADAPPARARATSPPSTSRTTARSSSVRPSAPLPQLKITVDDEGYLIADAGFAEPVGPSFWKRER